MEHEGSNFCMRKAQSVGGNTIKAFEKNHTELKVNYIWTGADELNSKKKTHMLLYVFTERKK